VARIEARIQALEAELKASRTPDSGEIDSAPTGRATTADLEDRLGTYWLSRLGILALITGIAFLVIYKFGELGVALRVAAGYFVGAILAATGRWVSRRHRVFGEVLVGGGLAVGYFITYALHFVPAVRVVESDFVAMVLLATAIAAVVAIAHRMRSETVAGIALFLGLHSGMLTDVSALTLLATCLLAGGGVFFLVANRWVVVPVSALIAAYATHARWVMARPDTGSHALSLGFLTVYFALFAAAILLRPGALRAYGRVLLPLANALGLVSLGWWELRQDQDAWFPFFVAVAVAHTLLAIVANARERGLRELVEVHLGVALGAAALASWSRFEGASFGALLALIACGSAALARARLAPALGWVGLAVLLAGLARPPLLAPDPLLLAALAIAGAIAGEWQLPAAARGWEAGLLGGYASASTVALLRFASSVAPKGLETLAWAIAASFLFITGFLARARRYRIAGFTAFALAGGRLLAIDFPRLDPDLRIATFLLLGILLLGVSFAYARRVGRASKRS